MREQLAALDGQRITVTGIVLRHGSRIGWNGVREPTVCLGHLTTLDGALLTDHLWFRVGTRLAALDLHPGDRVQLTGRVGTYRRGLKCDPGESVQYGEDFKIRYPSKLILLSRAVRPVPAPISPAATAIGPTNRERILAALVSLCGERQEPPSLTRLMASLPLPPLSVAHTLRKLARAGAVCFAPDGSLLLTA